MLHICFDADRAALLNARDEIARAHGYWLFTHLEPTEVPGWCKTESYVGDRLLGVENDRVLQLFTDLMRRATQDD